MKKPILSLFILFSLVLLSTTKVSAQYLQYEPAGKSTKKLENSWYKATVVYVNPGTGTKAKYTLNVKVEFNRVTAISFGNEGSVHTGLNNSGYYYVGGDLKYQHDSDGEIVSATTQVNIIENGSTKSFYISIQ